MPLSLQHRRLGDFAVVTCTGRLVEGDDSAAIGRLLDELLPFGGRIVLDVAAVDFIDSAGIGLLVRYSTRMAKVGGGMHLCAASPRLRAVLKATRLEQVLLAYASEAEAIAAFHERSASAVPSSQLHADVLCVLESADVQAYVRGILGPAGYAVQTVSNIPDAVVLLQVTRPKLVVLSAELAQARGTNAAEKFRRLAQDLSLIQLPPDFSQQDPDVAARMLLDQLRTASAPS